MGILNWLVGEAVEAPGISMMRAEVHDPAIRDIRCTDFSDYLKQRGEIVAAAERRLEAQYRDAEKRARAVCENYAEGLAERERRLTDAEEAFLSRRKVVIATLRDSGNTALAEVIGRETMVRREK